MLIFVVEDETERIGTEDVLGDANREEIEGSDKVMRWFGGPRMLGMVWERLCGKCFVVCRMIKMLFMTEVVDGN